MTQPNTKIHKARRGRNHGTRGVEICTCCRVKAAKCSSITAPVEKLLADLFATQLTPTAA